jgi:hypothetical protein
MDLPALPDIDDNTTSQTRQVSSHLSTQSGSRPSDLRHTAFVLVAVIAICYYRSFW